MAANIYNYDFKLKNLVFWWDLCSFIPLYYWKYVKGQNNIPLWIVYKLLFS